MSESSTNSERQPRIGFKVVWIGIVGMGLVLFVLVLVMALGSGVSGRVSELKAQGEPTSAKDLAAMGAEVPEAENAAVALRNASPAIEQLLAETSQIIRDRNYEVPLSDQEAGAAQAIFDKHQSAMAAIRQAIALPRYGTLLKSSSGAQLLEQLQQRCERTRALARVLALQSELLAREGKLDEATLIGVDIIRYGRHFGEEPSQMAFLVSLALRQMGAKAVSDALQEGGVQAPTRETLRKELAAGDIKECFVNSMRTERAVAIEMARVQRAAFGMARQVNDVLNVVEQQIDDVKANGLANANAAPPPGSFAGPSIAAAKKAALRWVALSRCLQVLDRLTESGSENATLDDLDLPAEVKSDPFSPKPLTVERVEKGWAVYSIGQDGVYKSGKGDDIGFRKKPLR